MKTNKKKLQKISELNSSIASLTRSISQEASTRNSASLRVARLQRELDNMHREHIVKPHITLGIKRDIQDAQSDYDSASNRMNTAQTALNNAVRAKQDLEK